MSAKRSTAEGQEAVRPRGRAMAFRVLAVGLALGAAVLTAELALRLVPAAAGYRSAPVDEGKAWTVPGSRRLRSPPEVQARPPGVFRLVTIGDSYTWGDGVYPEDTWPARLERRLEGPSPGREVDLVNLSRPGWNTYQELWWFRREIDRLDPDLAVLGYVLNDAEPFDATELAELQRVLGPLARPTVAPPSAAVGPSVLFRRLAASWSNLRSRQRVRRYYRSLYDHEPGWSASRRALDGFARLSSDRSVPFLMVVFPVFDGPLDHRYPYREIHELVAEAGEQAGLPVLDLLAVYQGLDARRLAVVPFTDPHPNELAHRIAADAIADHLAASGLLRPD